MAKVAKTASELQAIALPLLQHEPGCGGIWGVTIEPSTKLRVAQSWRITYVHGQAGQIEAEEAVANVLPQLQQLYDLAPEPVSLEHASGF